MGGDGHAAEKEQPPVAPPADQEPPATPDATAPPKEQAASIYPGPEVRLPPEFCDAVRQLESAFDLPILMVLQGRGSDYSTIDETMVRALRRARAQLPEDKRVGLLIDSPGGDARAAYQVAMLLRKRCGGFIAIIPRAAKSAATLLALGADEIALGTDGELGPLDALFADPDREDLLSALDEFQALERLHAFALEAVDTSMMLLLHRTRKKVETLMPFVLRFVTDMTRPMFENIDVVHYTQMARILKVAEDYAVRLLRPKYSPKTAEGIARDLVQKYPEHGFVINAEEAESLGLKTMVLSSDQTNAVDALLPMLDANLAVFGCLTELKKK
jgi:hypothetical protein